MLVYTLRCKKKSNKWCSKQLNGVPNWNALTFDGNWIFQRSCYAKCVDGGGGDGLECGCTIDALRNVPSIPGGFCTFGAADIYDEESDICRFRLCNEIPACVPPSRCFDAPANAPARS